MGSIEKLSPFILIFPLTYAFPQLIQGA
jgi:hypothetical protein